MKKTYVLWLLGVIFIFYSCASPNDVTVGRTAHSESQRSTISAKTYAITQIATSFVFPLASWSVGSNVFNTVSSIPGYKSHHLGVDANAAAGMFVESTAVGVVRHAKIRSGYGLVVIIEHTLPDGSIRSSLYGHLDPDQMKVSVGSVVQQRSTIGVVGNRLVNGGWSPHLHFAIKRGPFQEKTNACGNWEFAGYVDYDCAQKQEVINSWENPIEFVNRYTDNLSSSQDAINRRMNGLGARALNGVHWYGGYNGRVGIQDITLNGGCSGAIVFDHEGGAHKAYVVKCGMWAYWSSKAGPASVMGMPITEEYQTDSYCSGGVCKKRVRQDFKNAYLEWQEGRSPDVVMKTYKRYTPGKFSQANGEWRGRVSYLFAEAYERLGAYNVLGSADHPTGGLAEVHDWVSRGYVNWVQDFVGPKFGWTILMLNDQDQKVYMLRSGFWQQYRDLKLIETLGQPKAEEYLVATDHPRQEFRGGWMEYDRGSFRACMSNGVPACGNCGACAPIGGPGTEVTPICTPKQEECLNSATQRTCSVDGLEWIPKTCPNGCLGYACNSCAPGTTWCDSISSMQTCNPDGKSFTTKPCSIRCDQGSCIDGSGAQPCSPGQTVCKDRSYQRTCGSDGKTWQETVCAHGCAEYSCLLCEPKSQWCFDNKTIEVCADTGRSTARTSCPYGCDKDACNSASRICVPDQRRCDGSVQETCSADGTVWNRLSCPNGCSSDHCNMCIPGSTWCFNTETRETCDPSGKSSVRTPCVNGCVNNACAQALVCATGEKRCSGNSLEQCSSDQLAWNLVTVCASGCSNNACVNPSPNTLCVPNERRCVNASEIQQCRDDGAAWIHQYHCPNSLCSTTTASCISYTPACSVSYDPTKRVISVSGTIQIDFWSSDCKDMANPQCWIIHHDTQGKTAVIPNVHTRVYARSTNPANAWVYRVRECSFPSDAQWIESSTGGFIRLLK